MKSTLSYHSFPLWQLHVVIGRLIDLISFHIYWPHTYQALTSDHISLEISVQWWDIPGDCDGPSMIWWSVVTFVVTWMKHRPCTVSWKVIAVRQPAKIINGLNWRDDYYIGGETTYSDTLHVGWLLHSWQTQRVSLSIAFKFYNNYKIRFSPQSLC